MKKVLILLLLSLSLLTGCIQKSQVSIKGYTFDVELASNTAERTKGLMFRESLDLDKGMLFIFPTSEKHSFWMKNTYLPLDLIWINEDLDIVHIHKNAQPHSGSIVPNTEAKYVLEINAGLVDEYNFKLKDKIEIK